MTKHPDHRHPDIEALLSRVSLEEAARLREVWELAGDQDPIGSPGPEEVERALQRLDAALGKEEHSIHSASLGRITTRRPLRMDRLPQERRGTLRPRRRAWRGWAAFVAVLLLGGFGLVWWLRPVEQVAPLGERLAFTLPDGSRVELNSGSRLRYARWFGDERTTYLMGEAFFDVVEEGRPFVVETADAHIRVLGTRFGVRAWPGGLSQGTTVALESGRVALAPIGQPDQAVAMVPGEIRRVDANATDVEPYTPDMSVDDVTAWRRGDLVFKDQFLGIILEDVEQRFAVELQVHPLHLRTKRYSLAIRRVSEVEPVVHALAVALGLRYRETSNGYELYAEAQ